MKKSVSDSTLDRWWRLVIKAIYKKCVICNNRNMDEVECHHVVHRNYKLLKWDYRNGVPVCSFKQTGRRCHSKADTLMGKEVLKEKMGEFYEHIKIFEINNPLKKQYLVDRGITDNDFRLEKLQELKDKYKESNNE